MILLILIILGISFFLIISEMCLHEWKMNQKRKLFEKRFGRKLPKWMDPPSDFE
jgi:hypothetical protein